MLSTTTRRLLAITTILLTATAASVSATFGQEQLSAYETTRVTTAQAAAPDQTSAEPASATILAAGNKAYAPLMTNSPRVGPIQFAASSNDNGLVNPTPTFNYGLARIYFGTLVEGYPANTAFRIEFSFPSIGGGTSTVIDDTIRAPRDNIVYDFYIVNRATGQATGDPLPRGTYTAKFFIGDTLLQQGSAVIR